MKIIDLLNKIANGGKVPKRIKTNNRIYHYCPSCDTYEDEKEKDIVIPIDKYCLNDTVEIIEEQQDTDIQEIEELDINEENVTKGNIIDAINDKIIWAKQIDKKMRSNQ